MPIRLGSIYESDIDGEPSYNIIRGRHKVRNSATGRPITMYRIEVFHKSNNYTYLNTAGEINTWHKLSRKEIVDLASKPRLDLDIARLLTNLGKTNGKGKEE
jgi:hypothetical protein